MSEHKGKQVLFICDGCGVMQQGFFGRYGQAFKPPKWFQRTDDDGTQLACSRECIDRIAKETGKSRVVLPI